MSSNEPTTKENISELVSKNGGLRPFSVNFLDDKGKGISARRQAEAILNEVSRLHELGATKVGITYSANQGQMENIIDVYKRNEYKTGTNGSNQAAVIKEIELLLATDRYKHLQDVYRTIPITTMKYGALNKKEKADDVAVDKSLENANQFIGEGGVLLGWTNQFTKKGSLAIGGGVAAQVQSKEQKTKIDDWVKDKLTASPFIGNGKDLLFQLQNKYEYKPFAGIQPRNHSYDLSGNQFFKDAQGLDRQLREELKHLRGDALKAKILEDFKEMIEGCTDIKDLDEKTAQFKLSTEYQVLATGQDFTTRTFGLKTSSVKALEQMVDDMKEKINLDNQLGSYGP